ncbi:MAG: hypothetical protein QXW86_13375, partial [Saccharolobus sp.]|uniref:glycosyltransferase family 39 protein n=1 Tax=Saccharolobus sp. TaxID=2100761 RepID=UPI00316D358F
MTKIKIENNAERLTVSYILSLSIMFGLLYLGGITYMFNISSYIFLMILIISFIHLTILLIRKIFSFQIKIPILKVSSYKPEVIITIITSISAVGLLAVYVLFLSSRAILDSDVVHYYLPIAREIVRENGFTYSNGYDYNVLLKPIGASIIYGWVYVVSGSTLLENFRFMPLVPITILIILNYAVSTLVTKSHIIGAISSLFFLLLPFHDRLLLYQAFYPDIFYYPLIIAAVYFLLDYHRSKRSLNIFWTGLGFGAASLLKAQTIYFLMAFIYTFIILKLKKFKKASVVLCILIPFFTLVPLAASSSIRADGFTIFIPNLSEKQLILLVFLSMLSGLGYYLTIYQSITKVPDKLRVTDLMKKLALLLIPFAALSSLWYVNNILKFRTPIWTSLTNLPNIDWAAEILKSIEPPPPEISLWYCITYLMFAFVDPAVMGYVVLVPLITGFLIILRKRLEEDTKIILFFALISMVNILSFSVFTSPIPVYNPRDIFPALFLLTVLPAVSIVYVTFSPPGNRDSILMLYLLVTYYGLLSYVHSVHVYFTNLFHETTIGILMSTFVDILGLNLRQTSFQLPAIHRVTFVFDSLSKIILLSLITGSPILVLIIWRHFIVFVSNYISKGHIKGISFLKLEY